jgi:hypothetical protein
MKDHHQGMESQAVAENHFADAAESGAHPPTVLRRESGQGTR